jgi:hypothetical protein
MSIVSIYENNKDTTSQYTIPVLDALYRIRDGKSRKRIEDLRQMDKVSYNQNKGLLPSITFSGTFSKRNDKDMLTHSGFLCIDFDSVDNVEVKKEQLSKIPYIYAAWISPSGEGVKALVRVPPIIENHRKHYQALLEAHPDMDKSCINESRFCYESYDPNIYINEKSEIYTKTYEKREERFVKKVEISEYSTIFENLLKWQSKNSRYFESGNRNTFVFVLAGALCRYGVPMSEAQYLISNQIHVNNDFSESEMIKAIQQGYKTNSGRYATEKFETEEMYVQTMEFKRDIEYFETEFDYKDIIFGDFDGVIDVYDNGYGSAETTYYTELDKHFKWKRGDWTLTSGAGNHGKTSVMLQLMLIKSINDGVKWALFVPENMPSKLFYTELTEMLVGCDITPSNPHRPNKDSIEQIADFLSEHFIVVHPKELAPTPQYIKSKFLGLIMHKGVSGIFIDPFNRLMNDYTSTSGRDDKYLEAFLADMSNFVKHHDLYSCIIAHPTKLRKVDGEKDYPCPDVFNIAGGAMWNNMMDNILFWHRPYKISEPNNPLCIFKSAKIRWKKIVGHEGEIEFMYDFKRRRYYLDNFCPLDTNPFNFVEGGVMFEDVVKDTTGKRIETNPYRMTDSDHKQMLEHTFYDVKPLSMKDFAARLKQSLQRYGYPISKSAEFKQYYIQNNYLTINNGMYFIETPNNEN